ncbi:MAG: hypothetical protein IPN15_07255 [Saprospiraceae bacterium]|nr:hypothetical protein [Candidatus Vicinibacter affinis]
MIGWRKNGPECMPVNFTYILNWKNPAGENKFVPPLITFTLGYFRQQNFRKEKIFIPDLMQIEENTFTD